jgi:putative copper export protein
LRLQSQLLILFPVQVLIPSGGRNKFVSVQIVGQLLKRERLLTQIGRLLLTKYVEALPLLLQHLCVRLHLRHRLRLRLRQRQELYKHHATGRCLSKRRLSFGS